MRDSVLAFLAAFLISYPAAAQSNVALEQVTEGFGRGQCNPLTHQGVNPETGTWMTIDPSPWTGWTIERIGPRTLQYERPGDEIRLMEFEEGVYRDRAPDSMEDAEEWTIVEHGIHGPDNWRILMTPPEFSEAAPSYSEIIIAGAVFIWSNWADQADGSRIRLMFFACEFAEG